MTSINNLLVKIFILILLLCNYEVKSQYDLNWHIGACTYIDYKNGNLQLTHLQDTLDGFIGSNSCISRKDSSFAAFTNGTIIYRPDGSIMPNGDSLGPTQYMLDNYPFGSPSSQGCLFIFKPNSDSILYLIHQTINIDSLVPITNTIYLSIINLASDSGRGIVVAKNIHLYNSTDSLMHGKLQTVKHANGRDWWLISKQQYRNEFLEWLITPDSILGPTRISFNGNVGLDSYFAQAIFSLDGSKYAIIYWDECLQLFDFDRCSGNFSLIFNNNLNDNTGPGGGVAFSASGRFLYVTTSSYCYQFDMMDSNIFASKKTIATYDGLVINGIPYDFQRCRLAPDNFIYISPGSTNFQWSKINNPDLPDTLADLDQHVVNLFCYNNVAFPNLPNLNLGPITMSPCDTIIAIQELTINNLILAPNPVNSYFNISGDLVFPLTYSIYDITGREIMINESTMDAQINVEKLITGLYFFKGIDKSNRIFNLKFVKE